MSNAPASRPHVLVIVQNLPVPLDRRVWLECRALIAAGFDVSVICPKGPGDPSAETLDGVRIHKYRPAPQASGALGYLVEFVYSWLRTAWLSLRVWRERPFQAIQACNPPDTYWALARLWRRRGVAFVFDQHDLNPELFLSRFGEPDSLMQRLQFAFLKWLERRTYATADHVISTNESYKRIAIERGGFSPEDVTVVRSGPDTSTMRPIHDPDAPAPTRHTLAYLGIMGPQDGVETVLDVMDELVHRRGRTDVDAVLMGFGDCYEDLRRRSTELGLDDVVTFTGRVGPPEIARHLSAATVGLCPDLKTPLNDVSTMNKTMEYMAYALPTVSFDLVETRVSAGETCLFVESGDIAAFTDAVEGLLDDPKLRVRLAREARERVATHLDWKPQSEAYVGVWRSLLGGTVDAGPVRKDYVDLVTPEELERFVLSRGPIPPAS
ncbi:glycosyltransferase family 4 protein [Aeromicrobium choanae]|uniref:Glycosyltransferase involved in cell wall bisynthesis n=1 Tax=Aeromicrobium choanae TaxID=1736691 RepID=A0A1T4YT60_9ACTN|nr:glycosyltransferase family 4 protein [Aeromicrobium choanae]SKB04979.1 Glycosyltransferase involved in cell wall bisynthesis [Aeromicrobium choanae]